MRAKPMTAGEFVLYAASLTKDQRAKFDSAIVLTESVVLDRAAKMIEENVVSGEGLNPTQIAFNLIWKHEAKKIRDSANY